MIRLAGCRLSGRSGHAAGRELLARLYREETGEPLPPIRISHTGCPYFPGSPYRFSIAHTHRHAVCVLSTYPVGIDAEELDRPVRLSLAKRILSPEEYAQFLTAPNQAEALLKFWVLKEARAKHTGLGLQGFPNHTHFSLDDPRVWTWDGCLVGMIVTGENEGG